MKRKFSCMKAYQSCGDTCNKCRELKNDKDEVTEHQERARRFQDQLANGSKLSNGFTLTLLQ